MNQTHVRTETPTPQAVRERAASEAALGGLILLILLLLAAVSLYALHGPAAVGSGAPPTEFSSARALRHVAAIAERPRPVGAEAEHGAARDYLLKELGAAGLSPQVQKTVGVNADLGGAVRAGAVENVLARLGGTSNTKAVLLVAHYDSVSTGFGASDDGAGVGALLETARALKAGPVPKNDVIFLFTDGEEVGMTGARAFVDEHPWRRDVGVALNFEARGNSGPSIMFETSPNNGWLVEQYAQAAPRPVGNSLAYEIYRLLPNDTDLTVFKRAGYPGLNFAYIDGPAHYHTALDTVARLDERSLQHHGVTALALARRFGELDLRDVARPDAVYFDLFGATLVNYSGRWVWPLAVLGALLFGGLFVYGLRRGRLSLGGTAGGFAAFLLSLVVAPLVATGVWRLVSSLLHKGATPPLGVVYNSGTYLLGFAALTVGVTAALYALFGKRVRTANLTAGVLFGWVLLLLLSSALLPGASYLFTWPLLFSLIAWGAALAASDERAVRAGRLLLGAVCAAPGIVLFAPTVYQVFVGLTLEAIGTVMVVVALLLSLLVPHLSWRGAAGRWLLPGGAALCGVVLLAAGLFNSRASAETPDLDQLFYGLNGDTGRAVWASLDRRQDEWTREYLSPQPPLGPASDFLSPESRFRFPQTPAPAIPLPAPVVSVLADRQEDGARQLSLRITSPRGASGLAVYVDSKAEVVAASLNGKPAAGESPAARARRGRWGLVYTGLPPEGIELALTFKADEPLKLRVVDQSAGLPQVPGASFRPRPEQIIPAPHPLNDSTLVTKTFVY
ncbi:MAG: M20/M25/M40 family metallo-hydrolase [Pyrinomonadaceae bacterium]